MKAAANAFLLPAGMDTEDLMQQLYEQCDLVEERPREDEEVYLDTFDWQLYRQSLVLVRCGRLYRLLDFQGAVMATGHGLLQPYPFAWDFTDPSLAEIIEDIIKVRALMPLVSICREQRFLRLVNQDDKTILRMSLESLTVPGSEQENYLARSLRLRAVRGYEKPLNKVQTLLAKLGIVESYSENQPLNMALSFLGRQPLDYSSAFLVPLQRDETTDQAMRRICLFLLQTMQHNQAGIIADIDTEFLHDFRVSVRRTRSLLSMMKKVFPKKEVRFFLQEFKWLGTKTGNVRDLDVYLLEEMKYQGMLPDVLQDGLHVFFQELFELRQEKFAGMVAALKSERYQDLVEQWQGFLGNEETVTQTGPGIRPCQQVAVEVLEKQFKRIQHDGSLITDTTPDESLHRLRIQAKKFRYLLEAFATLLPATRTTVFVSQLKKFQNNLGDFNDLSVQQHMLVNYLAVLKARNKPTLRMAASLGGLIAHLARRQQQVRRKFSRRFVHFESKENRILFEKMLKESIRKQQKKFS